MSGPTEVRTKPDTSFEFCSFTYVTELSIPLPVYPEGEIFLNQWLSFQCGYGILVLNGPRGFGLRHASRYTGNSAS